MRLLLLFSIVIAAWPQCLPVQSERILAEDLARAIPAFAEARGQLVALSPLAGAERRFLRAELVRTATRLGLRETSIRPETWPESVCFAYPEGPLDQERLERALREVPGGGLEVDIVDYSRFPVPPGPIEFARPNLSPDRADGTRLLRGSVVYSVGRRQPIWVRVRPRAQRLVLVAARDVEAGESLTAESVRSEPNTPGRGRGIASLSEIEGLSPRRGIQAGTRLERNMFTRVRDVDPGQTIQVSVTSGAAKLGFEARAETGGFAGDQILIRSPLSAQRLKVRVAGRGKAEIDVSVPAAEE